MSRKFSENYPERGLVMDFTIDTSGNSTADNFAAGTKINGTKLATSFVVSKEILAATANEHVWIAPFACQVVSIREIHSVVGGSSAAVRPRKITDTSAPNAAASSTVKELTTATFDLTATANTVVAGTLSATATDLQLAVGDHIALNFSGTLTGLVGTIAIELKPL